MMKRSVAALAILIVPAPAFAEDRSKVSGEQRAIRNEQRAVEALIEERMDQLDEVLDFYDEAVDPAKRYAPAKGAARSADGAVERTTDRVRDLYEDAIRNQMRYYGE